MIDTNIIVSFLFILLTAISIYFKIVNQYAFIIWILSIYFLLSHYKFKITKKSLTHILSYFNKKSFYFLLFLFFIPRIILLYNAGILQCHHDEATFAFNAYHAVDKSLKTMNFNILGDVAGPISWFPAIWFYIIGGMEYIFGFNNYIPRLFSLATDLAMFCGVWFYCIRILKSHKIAFASCFVYNFFFPNIFYSKVILNNDQGSLMILLVLISLMIASENEDRLYKKCEYRQLNIQAIKRYYLLTGVLSGLALYFYLSSILIPVYILGFLFFYSCLNRFKDFKRIIFDSFYYFLGYLFTAVPFWVYSFFTYNFLSGRYGVNVLSKYRENFFPFFKFQITSFTKSLYELSFAKGIGGVCISLLLIINLYKSIGTFDRGFTHLKKRIDFSLGFLPIYKKVKLAIYIDAPQHIKKLLPLYAGEPYMKIEVSTL